ncbi:hypothetical protein H257_03002 [Aphanomyces astaci]|uniref:Uncharacterized protein n=1 Tax=Aphanomyces astaci TaxID=112090 RepID=W4GZT8_APHAT|nr:hypothetical protein H257_03002 [Aphanomyces astaci]ETV85162.1 hypothetical protein H257_03002 [Aphanomyces astaci]|eukprot:XP_009825180.1 hypothetical protein H257_03002 [Aphanomyces astaci]
MTTPSQQQQHDQPGLRSSSRPTMGDHSSPVVVTLQLPSTTGQIVAVAITVTIIVTVAVAAGIGLACFYLPNSHRRTQRMSMLDEDDCDVYVMEDGWRCSESSNCK